MPQSQIVRRSLRLNQVSDRVRKHRKIGVPRIIQLHSLERSHTAEVVVRDAEEMICQAAVRVCVDYFGAALQAVVLTGSLARHEATMRPANGSLAVLGDAEFLLVFHERSRLPAESETEAARRSTETNLLNSNLDCKIDLSAVPPKYLRNLPPYIFSYELAANGRVIWGDTDVLALIPLLSVSGLSHEDAWRLLGNRTVELLEAVANAGECSESGIVQYRTSKLCLDMATSLLVFAGAYAPSYRQRNANLKKLAARTPNRSGWPFDLQRFAKQVSACTDFKLRASADQGSEPVPSTREMISCARQLWEWELVQLSGAPSHLSGRELLFHRMRLQPAGKQIRGWLYTLRRCGWHRSWHYWPRWIRLAWRGSPRDWVYAATSEILAHITSDEPESRTLLEHLRSWLPLQNSVFVGRLTTWQMLALEIASNYHELLERTRA